jgi:hypothetical protein
MARSLRLLDGHPADPQRHHDVLERRELAQQMMELKHKAHRAVPERIERLLVSASTACPPRRIRPADGRSSAPSMCNSVLFPAPLSPTMATISPRRTVQDTLRRAPG